VNIHTHITNAGVGGMAPTRIDAVAAALSRWMGDRELRNSAAARTRQFVKESYDWRAIAQRWAERYERLSKRHVPMTTASNAVVAV
jgi:glycosyltransferase involved in cell wall biosynthesis